MGKNNDVNDWTDPRCVVRCIGPKLVPFFKTVAIYFVLADRESETWLTCVLKCLPIIWLCIFVVLNGISFENKHVYNRRILLGLIFSMIGDAFLVSSAMFLYGLFAFSVAHVFYIAGLGFKPFSAPSAIFASTLASIALFILWSQLTGIFMFAVPYYATLLSVMLWRSLARVQFNDVWTWTQLCSCVGGILFVISDGLLALNQFSVNIGLTPKQSQMLVMITYYSAQMGIALSVVDNKSILALSQRNSEKQAKN